MGHQIGQNFLLCISLAEVVQLFGNLLPSFHGFKRPVRVEKVDWSACVEHPGVHRMVLLALSRRVPDADECRVRRVVSTFQALDERSSHLRVDDVDAVAGTFDKRVVGGVWPQVRVPQTLNEEVATFLARLVDCVDHLGLEGRDHGLVSDAVPVDHRTDALRGKSVIVTWRDAWVLWRLYFEVQKHVRVGDLLEQLVKGWNPVTAANVILRDDLLRSLLENEAALALVVRLRVDLSIVATVNDDRADTDAG